MCKMCLQAPRLTQAFGTRGMRGVVHFHTNDCILKKMDCDIYVKNVLDRLQRVTTVYMRYQCTPDTTVYMRYQCTPDTTVYMRYQCTPDTTVYMRYQCTPDTTSKSCCNVVVVHNDTLLLCFRCPTADLIRTRKGMNFSLHLFQNVRWRGLFVKRCASTGVRLLDAIRIVIT